MVWDFDNPYEEVSESLRKIGSQLAAIIHAAIEEITENSIVSEIHNNDSLTALIGFDTRKLEKISEEPEVSRKCPFCQEQLDEHYHLAKHISKYHPKKAVKKYEKSIQHYYKHPEDVGPRHQLVTKIMTGQDQIYGNRILCPFCEEPFPEHELKKHVNQKHGEFMEAFYNVLKEGGK